jgi:hypothetical protein
MKKIGTTQFLVMCTAEGVLSGDFVACGTEKQA